MYLNLESKNKPAKLLPNVLSDTLAILSPHDRHKPSLVKHRIDKLKHTNTTDSIRFSSTKFINNSLVGSRLMLEHMRTELETTWLLLNHTTTLAHTRSDNKFVFAWETDMSVHKVWRNALRM